jgi:tRNA(Ile)-lysidine synthase
MMLAGVVRDSDPISEDEAAVLFDPLWACRVLVLAVSGGPDSTALLWLLARWRDAVARPPRLIAVTVDHGLREESALEAQAVGNLAARLKVKHRTLRWTGAKPTSGIQAAAREARYRLLVKAVSQARGEALVTAHTLDDQAETMLFRMARGSGLDGLAGMEFAGPVPVPEGAEVPLIRPLLPVAKARLIATLTAANIPYAADPSNTDPRFARPRWRALMPLLADEGLTAERLGKLALRIQRAEDALTELADEAQAALCPGLAAGRRANIDAARFLQLPEEISLRLLRRMVDSIGDESPAELGQVEALHVELRQASEGIEALGVADSVRRTLAGSLVTLSGAKLTVERAPPRRTGAKTGKPRIKAPFTKPR